MDVQMYKGLVGGHGVGKWRFLRGRNAKYFFPGKNQTKDSYFISMAFSIADATSGEYALILEILDAEEPEATDTGVTNFIARQDNHPAGCAQLFRRGPEEENRGKYWLGGLCVKKRFRRTGLGEQLCRAVIARVQAEGGRELSLAVDAGNAAALGLYRKLGFVQHRNPFPEDAAHPTRIIFRRDLA
jgi:GNAT superfamily N-acetyltransferase